MVESEGDTKLVENDQDKEEETNRIGGQTSMEAVDGK